MLTHRYLDPGVRLTYKALGPGTTMPWHDHGAATLCVVFAGLIEEEDARGARERRPGDLVFRPTPEPHRNRVGDRGVRLLTMEIGPVGLRALREEGLRATDTCVLTSPRAACLARLARGEIDNHAAGSDLRLQGLVYDLLATAVSGDRATHDPSPPWLEAVESELREGYQRPPSLDELARRHDISARRASVAFRRRFGVSIIEYVHRVRVEHAADLLALDGQSLNEIALDCGFYDQSHLTNVFKKHTGLTPGEFRRRVRSAH